MVEASQKRAEIFKLEIAHNFPNWRGRMAYKNRLEQHHGRLIIIAKNADNNDDDDEHTPRLIIMSLMHPAPNNKPPTDTPRCV